MYIIHDNKFPEKAWYPAHNDHKFYVIKSNGEI